MAAGIYNFRIEQGATTDFEIVYKDSNGTPVDLTGYTASAKMAKGYASTRTRTIITTSINSDPTTGVIVLSLTADQTNNLDAAARYVYDIEITRTSDSTVTRVIEGIITISPSVTI